MSNSTLSINIGIDWGTSFSKICVQANDTEQSEIVVFKDLSLDGTFLLSKIGILSNGRLLAGLTKPEWDKCKSPNMFEVNFLKMRLANIDLPQQNHLFEFSPLPQYKGDNLNLPKNLENLGAYYLAQVIKKVKNWFCQKYPQRIKNRELEWSANVGVPVQYCNSPSLTCFERVLRIAWLLTEELDLDSLTFSDLKAVTQTLTSKIDDQIPCFAVPEVAAGTYFYATSRERKEGQFLYVDIGSGTTEFCSFHLGIEGGLPNISAIKAYTPPIGIDAIAYGIASESKIPFEKVQNLLNGDYEDLADQISALIKTFDIQPKQKEFIASADQAILQNYELSYVPSRYITQKAIDQEKIKISSNNTRMLLELMLWERAIHLVTALISKNTNGEILLGGGGCDSKFYRYAIESTYTAFKQYRSNDYCPLKFKDVTLKESPENFKMNGIKPKYSHRFTIAFGLSIPNYEMPDFQLPKLQDSLNLKPTSSEYKKGIEGILADLYFSGKNKENLSVTGDWRDT
ncbi:hypothetical protein PN462_09590 [Spirulina sp. CS-785/01]|uniref:hypothetical protein n=1 Tax=Spirulina sp. CS-785/01 TaxID=3021716 RepID=UPI00232E5EE9|nr:hypothetical protein [Spirulina sp. CS-785/01]MDB9313350.1 hypothetical protein [Spirulina sp. CS-785/01]